MPQGTIAVVGAGWVGGTIAYALLLRGLARRVILIDADAAKARGHALDLAHAAPFLPAADVVAGEIDAAADADVVIFAAGAKQHPGQTRLALAETNVAILRGLIPQLVARAPRAWLLIVSNPVDVLTAAARRFSGWPAERVVGSGTVLDTARFRHLLAQRLRVAPQNVHAYIVGEHGDSEIALWSCAQVAGVPLAQFARAGEPALDAAGRVALLAAVRGAAGEIIAAKGATNWAIGVSTARIVEAYVRDEHGILTVCRDVVGLAGVPATCLSLPCIVSGQGASDPLPLTLAAEERTGLAASAAAVNAVLQRVGL